MGVFTRIGVNERILCVDFALIIPCYNFADGLVRTFDSLSAWRRGQALGCRVYFVNDGSTDDTLEKLKEFAARNPDWCEIVNLPINRGKGAAVRAGFIAARSHHSRVVFTDCDIHYGLDVVIDRILPGLETNDVVIVDRSWVDQSRAQTFLRRLSSALFSKVAGTLTGVLFRDTQAGLKGYRTEACAPIFELQRINSFSFDVEVLSIATYYRLRVHQVPIAFAPGYEFPKTSTIRFMQTSFSMLCDLLRINLNWKCGLYESKALSARIDGQIYQIK